MEHYIREMIIDDYPEVISFWKSCEGLNIDDSDLYENLEVYLKRNPGLSYIALRDNKIIGTIKCGQDGRRGYLHHLAIENKYRKLGIAKELLNISLKSLKDQGIKKCNAFILDTNIDLLSFWKHNGWSMVDYFYRTLQINIK